MNQDFSIVSLILNASFVVKLVMAGLLLTSLASWTVIFGKLFGLRKVRNTNEEFERDFWTGRNLNDLYNDAAQRADGAPMERIFASGMREFMKLRERRVVEVRPLFTEAAFGVVRVGEFFRFAEPPQEEVENVHPDVEEHAAGDVDIDQEGERPELGEGHADAEAAGGLEGVQEFIFAQGPADAAAPELGIRLQVLRHGFVGHDVGDPALELRVQARLRGRVARHVRALTR